MFPGWFSLAPARGSCCCLVFSSSGVVEFVGVLANVVGVHVETAVNMLLFFPVRVAVGSKLPMHMELDFVFMDGRDDGAY